MSLSDQQWCPTSVQVTVLQARGLRIKGKSGTNDAYAVMQVGKEKYQTSVVEKSVAPVWKEEAAFDLPPQLLQGGGGGGGGGERGTLHVHVLHRALVGPDKLLGQAVINLLQLSEDETRNKTEWFKLLDKTGKADKERGEVLLDIQFMRNNMTASMFDLSAAGKSRSRLGKFKDKVRGKKKESDAVSSVVPSFSQVLTDSEEEAHVDGEVATGKDEKKKKHKIKSLFSPKSNLQKNMSQSMSVLPGKNSSLSGSQSSGLNVESSEGKKKFKFTMHKHSGSSESKDSSTGHQKHGTAEQSNICINGSHVYCEEPQTRTSRIGSNFSLASSGHGSMEEVPKSSPPSTDSLRAARQYSPWMEEEDMDEVENIKEDVDEEEEEERIRMEEEIRKREDEKVRKQEKLEMLAEEKRKQEEEERKRVEERVKRNKDERIQKEEERKRQEEEERVRKEEQERLERKRKLEEQERRRIEDEKRQREAEEWIRMKKEKAQEQWRRQEEEERVRREEHKLAEEKRRLEEEERRIAEEKVRKEEERAEEERRRQEEEQRVKRQEEEHERKRRLEEQEIRQREEEERIKKEEERKQKEEERARKEKEEYERLDERRKQEEERKRIETEENIKREKEERKRREEEEREEYRRTVQEQERRRAEEEERRQREEQEKIKKEEERRQEEEERARKEKEEYERMVEIKKRQEEQERREKEQERIRMEEERRREEEKQEQRRRVEEQERRRAEEEKERIKKEEERARKEKEEYKRLMEEKTRQEEQERRQKEQERIRMEEERRREEEKQEQRRRAEEQERRKAEEEERRQREEQERIKKEEERRQEEEERARKEKEEYERMVEIKRLEEKERRQEEELIRKKEQERIRMEEENRKQEEERMRREREEMKRLAEEKRRQEKIEEEEKNRKAEMEKAERERKEDEARKLLEKEMLTKDAEKQKERENKSKGGHAAGRKSTVAAESPADVTSTNLFDDSYNPFEEDPDSSAGPDSSTTKVSNVQLRCQSTVSPVEINTISSDEEDLICAQRGKRPAPQPPGRNQAESHRETDVSAHLVQIKKQSDNRDVKTANVLPQRSVQMIAPVSRSPTDTMSPQSLMQSSTSKGTTSVPKQGKRPAPLRPGSVGEEPSSEPKTILSSVGNISGGGSDVKPVQVVYGLNPFEDDEEENEAQVETTASSNTESTCWPPAVSQTASHTKIKSSKVAHAPPPPAGLSIPDNSPNQACAPESEAIISVRDRPPQEPRPVTVHITMEEALGKQDVHPTTSRRLQPVKPLNALEQQSVLVDKGEKDNKSAGILGEVQDKTKVNDAKLKGPYSQLTQEELISLVLKQEKQLTERDKKISELEQYIDNLLVRVMEEKPSILMSMSSMKKAV